MRRYCRLPLLMAVMTSACESQPDGLRKAYGRGVNGTQGRRSRRSDGGLCTAAVHPAAAQFSVADQYAKTRHELIVFGTRARAPLALFEPSVRLPSRSSGHSLWGIRSFGPRKISIGGPSDLVTSIF
ncbi:unnamed protein product [Heligmosomoides polygyrus]|uniref:Secreted protein n=1 Tax=Heligmosomoides polygyrus TaxID=6339 RepID=A0A183FWE6_HELPZ|nr:unnamed protein product [Heligmosomoides polygyrus]